MRMRLRLAVLASSLLAGCAVGPDYHAPPAPDTDGYTPGGQPPATADAGGQGAAGDATGRGAAGDAPVQGAAAQHFVAGADAAPRWWESFGCAALDALVLEALAHSPTILEARSHLRQAQEDAGAQSGATLYPAVDAQLGISRQKVDPAAFGIPFVPAQPPFTLYNAQVNVSYTLDLAGGNRRLLEGMRARTEYQADEMQAAQATLAANVVTAAIRQADLQAQIDTTRLLLDAQERQLAIADRRYGAGGIALEDLHDQRRQLEQLRASLPPLEAQRRQIDHQLAVYTGKPPAAASATFKLGDLTLPTELPVALPADLVRRRPDVRAAEALWHEAGANVGVATANLFPNLTLSGYAGSDSTRPGSFADSFDVWSIGAKLLQPIFHAGELHAKKRSAVAAYDAAAQAYRQTVLESLQQVADSLRILEADAAALRARSLAAEQAGANFAIAQRRFDLGGISEQAFLDARRLLLETQLDRSHAAAQRLADTVALLHAVAGPVGP